MPSILHPQMNQFHSLCSHSHLPYSRLQFQSRSTICYEQKASNYLEIEVTYQLYEAISASDPEVYGLD